MLGMYSISNYFEARKKLRKFYKKQQIIHLTEKRQDIWINVMSIDLAFVTSILHDWQHFGKDLEMKDQKFYNG